MGAEGTGVAKEAEGPMDKRDRVGYSRGDRRTIAPDQRPPTDPCQEHHPYHLLKENCLLNLYLNLQYSEINKNLGSANENISQK